MEIAEVVNLGIGGFAILVMWWMYKSAQEERTKHFDAMRALESEIRNKMATQLQENANAMLEHSKIMQTVVELLKGIAVR